MSASNESLVVADRWGRAQSLSQYRKEPLGSVGTRFGIWSGPNQAFAAMPGGAILQFDLSKLSLTDFRVMRDHYQINASLTLLTFFLHQVDWYIQCEDKKIGDAIEENLREGWSRLVRAMSQAFWAGYSPIALEYENDIEGKRVIINKFKDLQPETCTINWKEIPAPGQNGLKHYEYDGIKQRGLQDPIPAENTIWYPLLMENGDMYGRKLLKPAFAPWFFSQLIHLFANRYYERFGEPLPIGRADFDAQLTNDKGEAVSGRDAMGQVLQSIRSRGVVVLPSDRDPATKEFDYTLEYLESQMRGGDWEAYLSRLDEEMSLALFTPVTLFRTGQTGSYNLGVSHLKTYLWSLNAIVQDMKEYIDRFIVARLRAFNFSPKAPRAEWVPRQIGRDNEETIRNVITELIRQGRAKPDYIELGQALGMTVEEIELVVDEGDVGGDPRSPTRDAKPTESTQRTGPGLL